MGLVIAEAITIPRPKRVKRGNYDWNTETEDHMLGAVTFSVKVQFA